eukprot:CAMPEP_0194264736 /NCGR_PEP_ID=MMETSP0169-20130528/62_1 /TAXON_ID=218684 /ORGANISM="Corethron pennatum, Strain L29A3" /LENGTH=180 /DNA_ID=CAMNT_0039004999 /DNA_START=73 /DNA_END=616 /DNA_ORIENTATION=-
MRLTPVLVALAAISRLVHCNEGDPRINIPAKFLELNEVEIGENPEEADYNSKIDDYADDSFGNYDTNNIHERRYSYEKFRNHDTDDIYGKGGSKKIEIGEIYDDAEYYSETLDYDDYDDYDISNNYDDYIYNDMFGNYNDNIYGKTGEKAQGTAKVLGGKRGVEFAIYFIKTLRSASNLQ